MHSLLDDVEFVAFVCTAESWAQTCSNEFPHLDTMASCLLCVLCFIAYFQGVKFGASLDLVSEPQLETCA